MTRFLLILSHVGALGCAGESAAVPIDASPDDAEQLGTLSVSWRPVLDGIQATCAAANIFAVTILVTGQQHYDADCFVQHREIELPGGKYDIALEMHPGIYGPETLASIRVEVRAGERAEIAFVLPMATFHARWSITSGGAPVDCADVGASWFSLDGLASGVMSCSSMEGRWPPYPLGEYTMTPQLIHFEPMGSASVIAELPSVTAQLKPGMATDLGEFRFEFP